jgi:hypothetical protein
MDLLESIHRDAFGGQPLDGPVDMQGWMDHQAFPHLFAEALSRCQSHQPLIVEVGTWKGLSACFMAGELRKKAAAGTAVSQGRIICVDTWLGSPEHLREHVGARDRGIPLLYRQFLRNVQSLDLQQFIFPFPMSSLQAGKFLCDNRIRADIVYIDAGHEYEAVKADMCMFWQLLPQGAGTMLLDDYKWPGVNRAIHEFVDENPLCHMHAINNVATILK